MQSVLDRLPIIEGASRSPIWLPSQPRTARCQVKSATDRLCNHWQAHTEYHQHTAEDNPYRIQRAHNSAELRSAASLRATTFSRATKQMCSELAALVQLPQLITNRLTCHLNASELQLLSLNSTSTVGLTSSHELLERGQAIEMVADRQVEAGCLANPTV